MIKKEKEENRDKIVSIDKLRELLNDEKYIQSLILASTRVEHILVEKLKRGIDFSERPLTEEELRKASFSTYRTWCERLELIDEEYLITLAELVKKRNDIVHEDSYLKKLQENKKERIDTERVLEDVIEYFKSEKEK